MKAFQWMALVWAILFAPGLAQAQRSQTLASALASGQVEARFTGTGASSGDAVYLTVVKTLRAGPGALNLSIQAGTILRSANSSQQNMIVARVRGRMVGGRSFAPARNIMLSGPQPVRYVLEAYCAEFWKQNPTTSTKLRLAGANRLLACVLEEGMRRNLPTRPMQAAVWIVTDTLTFQQIASKFPVLPAEWNSAEALVKLCRGATGATDRAPARPARPGTAARRQAAPAPSAPARQNDNALASARELFSSSNLGGVLDAAREALAPASQGQRNNSFLHTVGNLFQLETSEPPTAPPPSSTPRPPAAPPARAVTTPVRAAAPSPPRAPPLSTAASTPPRPPDPTPNPARRRLAWVAESVPPGGLDVRTLGVLVVTYRAYRQDGESAVYLNPKLGPRIASEAPNEYLGYWPILDRTDLREPLQSDALEALRRAGRERGIETRVQAMEGGGALRGALSRLPRSDAYLVIGVEQPETTVLTVAGRGAQALAKVTLNLALFDPNERPLGADTRSAMPEIKTVAPGESGYAEAHVISGTSARFTNAAFARAVVPHINSAAAALMDLLR